MFTLCSPSYIKENISICTFIYNFVHGCCVCMIGSVDKILIIMIMVGLISTMHNPPLDVAQIVPPGSAKEFMKKGFGDFFDDDTEQSQVKCII